MQVGPDPATLANGDQYRAQQTEQLKYMRMYYDGTIREEGDYVGTGVVFAKLNDDAARLSRESLVLLLITAMRQLGAAGGRIDGPATVQMRGDQR